MSMRADDGCETEKRKRASGECVVMGGLPRIGGWVEDPEPEEGEAREEVSEREWTEKGGDEAWHDPQHRRIAGEEYTLKFISRVKYTRAGGHTSRFRASAWHAAVEEIGWASQEGTCRAASEWEQGHEDDGHCRKMIENKDDQSTMLIPSRYLSYRLLPVDIIDSLHSTLRLTLSHFHFLAGPGCTDTDADGGAECE